MDIHKLPRVRTLADVIDAWLRGEQAMCGKLATDGTTIQSGGTRLAQKFVDGAILRQFLGTRGSTAKHFDMVAKAARHYYDEDVFRGKVLTNPAETLRHVILATTHEFQRWLSSYRIQRENLIRMAQEAREALDVLETFSDHEHVQATINEVRNGLLRDLKDERLEWEALLEKGR